MWVFGKYNDFEDVGCDGIYYMMFEMLGNWFFGDYFKKEVIVWLWELLIEVYNIFKENFYVIVFGGDEEEGFFVDEEAKFFWLEYLLEDYIFYGNKKDNFWEMGDIGFCGFCFEIYIDLCSDVCKVEVLGWDLVNMDYLEVIEIWNNVFI